MKIRYLTVARGRAIHIENYPNFHKSGSVAGMKKQYYGENALLVMYLGTQIPFIQH